MKKYPVLSSILAIKVMVIWTFFMATAKAQPNLSLSPVITGLSSPIQMVNAGDGSNRFFIVEKGATSKYIHPPIPHWAPFSR
ncbi:MAG: hypothetical protein IPN29_18300 [Saprospiraceae bacterium]|nr:hypothetical protein [Saprospiraceae bacterium]